MFRISDRYIIKSFLFAFVVCFAALVSLFVIVDTFSNLSNLIDEAERAVAADSSGAAAGAQGGGSAGIAVRQFLIIVMLIARMNVTRLPLIFYDLMPVITLSAAMFAVARLKRSNEIMPLLASGVSIYRVLWPVFFMAIVLTVVQVVDREVVMPRYSQNLYNWDRIRNQNTYRFRHRAMLEDGYGNVIFAGKYEVAARIQHGAHFTRYHAGATLRTPMVIINAQEAVWLEEPASGWLYRRGARIEYNAAGDLLRQERFGDEGVFVPLDLRGRSDPGFHVFTDTTPSRLETKEVDIFYRPTLYLLQYAHEHGLRADIALDLNKRIAMPLSNAILLLLGLPFVLRSNVKSPFLAILVAVGITFAYLALGIVTETFALEGRILTPLTGAWAPIIVFGPLGVLLFDTVES